MDNHRRGNAERKQEDQEEKSEKKNPKKSQKENKEKFSDVGFCRSIGRLDGFCRRRE